MTKKEAKKLGYAIIDYLVRLAGDIRRADITLCVQDDDVDDLDYPATTERDNLYDQHIIRVYLIYFADDKTTDRFVEAVCHEMAHVLTAGYASFYDRWIGQQEDGEEGSIAFTTFRQIEERAAMRLGAIFTELWKLHTREGKTK